MEGATKSSGDRNVDRLSALPDGVICHILSFLPIQRSVQTSVLARRWRNLWAHVPVLVFEGEDGSSYTTTTFSGIVCTVLLLHKAQTLNTFRLTYGFGGSLAGCNAYELETCITTVVVRNVQNLYLALGVEVPRCLLTCKTLVDLTLSYVSIPSNARISLPNLKKLHLLFLKCEVDFDFTRLLSGCPVIEELIINRTICSDPGGCCISSPTLKRLNIIYMLDSSMLVNPGYMVKINTPALRYLNVRDSSSKHISISMCISLVEADIWMYFSCVLKFLDSIRNVKYLQLTGSCEMICERLISGSIAKFGNLTKLDLCADWRLLSKFLESADHLQVLIIRGDDSDSKHWKDPVAKRCACLLHSLRTVTIDGFRCKEQGFDMVRYILRNAQVLQRMEIETNQWQGIGLKEKFDATQRILLFRRGSKECELAFT